MNLTNDFLIQIATSGIHRVNWKNQEMLWSDFVGKLSKTHRTFETYAEYMKADAARQSEIKNVGGYVAGYLAGGKRKKGSVVNRSMIVLDADFPPPGLWEDFCILYDNAAAMHSTHKHNAERPRIRLIIPMDREITAEEYEPIARRIASQLNIERIDHTSYEASRLMYWPSTSIDGVYVMEYQDGPRMCADDILATYTNWKDCSEWPQSTREGELIRGQIREQADPLGKRGIIGAFCRTYGMAEAIETFLQEEYEMCDVPARYTYREGSTAAGLVVYDDKYAYSHHGTDPASGLLCNVWDLVRIHKFSGLDARCLPDTPIGQRPSQKQMEEFATGVEAVRALIVNEKNESANYDFADIEAEPGAEEVVTMGRPEELRAAPDHGGGAPVNAPESAADDWKGKLKADKKGNVFSTVENMVTILENDPRLKGRFGFDEFRQRPVILRGLPWRKVGDRKYMEKKDKNQLYLYMEKLYGITGVKIDMALDCIFDKNRFHPVREYLGGLVWDKVQRVDTLLIDYLGAADTDYTRVVTRKWLAAAVARVMQPGIKFDYVLTLVGEEGKQKSTLFAKLGGEWFNDSFSFSMLHKHQLACEQLPGSWIMEIAEMSGYRKTDREAAKNFISRVEDTYRPSYGEFLMTFRRQCVFGSSTNEEDFLQSNNGNRRFWPVRVLVREPFYNVAKDLTKEVVRQIWAEAMTIYLEGEELFLSEEMETQARLVQSYHTESHPWTGIISDYLDMLLPKSWERKGVYDRLAYMHEDEEMREEGAIVRNRVCVSELWCEALGKPEKDLDMQKSRELHSIMRNMKDWELQSEHLRFGRYGKMRKGYTLKKDVEILRYQQLLGG